jgi:hypothetical protein
VTSVPDASDPSFAREQRRAKARQAAAEASVERQQELRSKYSPPPAPRPERSPRTSGRAASANRGRTSFDVAALAASARSALDDHPSTWTSYAEICAANGLDRGLAPAVARQLTPEPTGEHWFRIRNSDGVYDVPTAGTTRADPVRFGQAAADRALEALGIRVQARRADPERKLLWMHGEWCLAAR